jgi:hypothetical protein
VRAIFLISLAIFASMIFVEHHYGLGNGELVADCRIVATPAGESGQWRACTAGKLTGQPDLTRAGCEQKNAFAGIQYWSCPAPIHGSQGT